MAATTLVSLEEYLHTAYHPDMEYADGVLVGRNVGTRLHSLLQGFIIGYLLQFPKRFRVFPEARLRMGSSTRHCIPDVLIAEEPFNKGKVITDVPAAVFEIKSPDDRLDEIFNKCMDYAAIGVPNIVVLDPDLHRQYVFAGNALQLVESIVLHLPKTGDLIFPATEMFAQMDNCEYRDDEPKI